MDRLWAPWRIEYLRAPKEEGCIFCDKPAADDERETLILYRGEYSFILMNLYPYNNGHLMLAPYVHESDPLNISVETKSEIMVLADTSMEILKSALKAEGFNFGANIGKAGGAGIADHLHYHLVPRWSGDTNFMPVLGHTKIVMEGLSETYDSLRPAFDKIDA